MSPRKTTNVLAQKRTITAMIADVEHGKRLLHLDEYAALADHFGVPLWIMFIPDLPKEMLNEQKLKGLVQHVETHVAGRRLNGARP